MSPYFYDSTTPYRINFQDTLVPRDFFFLRNLFAPKYVFFAKTLPGLSRLLYWTLFDLARDTGYITVSNDYLMRCLNITSPNSLLAHQRLLENHHLITKLSSEAVGYSTYVLRLQGLVNIMNTTAYRPEIKEEYAEIMARKQAETRKEFEKDAESDLPFEEYRENADKLEEDKRNFRHERARAAGLASSVARKAKNKGLATTQQEPSASCQQTTVEPSSFVESDSDSVNNNETSVPGEGTDEEKASQSPSGHSNLNLESTSSEHSSSNPENASIYKYNIQDNKKQSSGGEAAAQPKNDGQPADTYVTKESQNQGTPFLHMGPFSMPRSASIPTIPGEPNDELSPLMSLQETLRRADRKSQQQTPYISVKNSPTYSPELYAEAQAYADEHGLNTDFVVEVFATLTENEQRKEFLRVYCAYPKADNCVDAVKAWKSMLALPNPPTVDTLLDSIAEHKTRKWDGIEQRYIPSFRNFLGKKMWLTYGTRAVPVPPSMCTPNSAAEEQSVGEELAAISGAICSAFGLTKGLLHGFLYAKNKVWHAANALRYVKDYLKTMPNFTDIQAWFDSIPVATEH